MKTALILTHVFPPVNVISVQRYLCFARYLPQFGWRPVVLTPAWTLEKRAFFERSLRASGTRGDGKTNWDPSFRADAALRVERVPFDNDPVGSGHSVRGLTRFFRLRKNIAIGNLAERFLNRAMVLAQGEAFDIVLASNAPPYIFKTADRLRRRYGIPWIADYRDLVDQAEIGHTALYRKARARISRRMAIRRDQASVRTAEARLAVSDGLAGKLLARNPIPAHVVMNGFDPEEFAPFLAAASPDPAVFRIVYAGTICPQEQDLGLFLRGLEGFLRRRPDLSRRVRAEFYGQSSAHVQRLPLAGILSPVVTSGGTLGRAAILEQMCSSDALLFLSAKSKGLPTGKVFEYLGARRRILSVPGDGDVTDQILAEAGTGTTADTPEKIAAILEAWVNEKRDKGHLVGFPDEQKIRKYTRQEQTRRLAEIMDGIIAGMSRAAHGKTI